MSNNVFIKLLAALLIALLLMVAWSDQAPSEHTATDAKLGHLQLGSKDPTYWDLSWSGDGQSLELLSGTGQDKGWLCPRSTAREQQPFCRHFPARFLDACHKDGRLQIVLTNGDIYRVDRALLATDRKFGRLHHAAKPLNLQSAWIPSSTCSPAPGQAQVYAIDAAGGVLHFDGQNWRQINQISALSASIETG